MTIGTEPPSRYRFVQNNIQPRPALKETSLGLTKNNRSFCDYMSKNKNYVDRLAKNNSKSTNNCPFCKFKIEPQNRQYSKGNREEQFVSTLKTHQSLWNKGLILTYNPSGWHLINELIISRAHVSNERLTKKGEKWLPVARSRWGHHRIGLKELNKGINMKDIHHGVAVNLRAGQSINHGHIHCFTSIHERKMYLSAREPIISEKIKNYEVDAYIVPFNIPRVIIEISPENIDNMMDSVATVVEFSINAFINSFTDLCSWNPPATISVFTKPDKNKYELIYHPMQRIGIMEHCYENIFHKFKTEKVAEVLKPKLLKKLNSNAQL